MLFVYLWLEADLINVFEVSLNDTQEKLGQPVDVDCAFESNVFGIEYDKMEFLRWIRKIYALIKSKTIKVLGKTLTILSKFQVRSATYTNCKIICG